MAPVLAGLTMTHIEEVGNYHSHTRKLIMMQIVYYQLFSRKCENLFRSSVVVNLLKVQNIISNE